MSEALAHGGKSLNRLAASATTHCLTGCAIGEVLGFVIGTAFGWGNLATIAIAVVLPFFFGYLLTSLPLLRSGLSLREVVPMALAADSVSIAIMEIVDNAVLLLWPRPREIIERFTGNVTSTTLTSLRAPNTMRAMPTGRAGRLEAASSVALIPLQV